MFEAVSGQKATEAEKVDLYGQIPPIEKMDTTLETLKACKCVARGPRARAHARRRRRPR